VLLAFSGGSTWRDWGNRSVSERRSAVLQAFAGSWGRKHWPRSTTSSTTGHRSAGRQGGRRRSPHPA
jgi:hypothetical protein